MNMIMVGLLLWLIFLMVWDDPNHHYIENKSGDYKKIYNNILAYEFVNKEDKNSLYYKKDYNYDLEKVMSNLRGKSYFVDEKDRIRVEYIKKEIFEYLNEYKIEKLGKLLTLKEEMKYQRFEKRFILLVRTIIISSILASILLNNFNIPVNIPFKKEVNIFIIGLIFIIILLPRLKKKKVGSDIDKIDEFISFIKENII